MPDWQKHPGVLHIDPTAPDGPYLIYKSGIRFSGFLRLVDGDGTTVNADTGTGTGTVSIDKTDAGQLYPLTSKVAGGDAGVVFGGPDDDDMIFTEGPL